MKKWEINFFLHFQYPVRDGTKLAIRKCADNPEDNKLESIKMFLQKVKWHCKHFMRQFYSALDLLKFFVENSKSNF